MVVNLFLYNKNDIKNHLLEVGKSLDLYTSKYDNFIFLGDFNVEMNDEYMIEFCSNYGLTSLIKEPTCFKNPENPSCIDLILTNQHKSFQNSCTYETQLSDFHLMTVSVMKTSIEKLMPKVIKYRDYKFFNNEIFRENLIKKLANKHNDSLFEFVSIAYQTLNELAPSKQRFVRGNQSPFINKEYSKAIMTRSRLRNKFWKLNTPENRQAYSKQRNYCVSLLRKTKRNYYNNLDTKSIVDNKCFWKSIKPLLSDKLMKREKINLEENDDIISNEKEVSEILNNFFSTIVTKLDIPSYDYDKSLDSMNDPVLRAVSKYQNHPSIKVIKENCKQKNSFSFIRIERDEVLKEIRRLDSTKACQDTDIPTKIIKDNAELFTDFLHPSINECLESALFPTFLKNANITPIHKKGSKHCKGNYRPVSILSNVSKIFERPIFYQMSIFFEKIFSNFQCGFRKGYSTQHCLLAMLEKWKMAVDKKKSFGVLLTDLSKAFDCLSHELLIAKLEAYGFSISALKLIFSYLSKRKQRTKVNDTYSSWEEILFGVPQGSILGPLLFNIFICDMFYTITGIDFASFADDNSPHVSGQNINEVIELLEEVSQNLSHWFQNNQMKANLDKYHLLLSTNETKHLSIGNIRIQNSKCEKLLGVKFDYDLKFKSHIEGICKRASGKLNALSRAMPYMDFSKKILVNAFFLSQFNYCPLIWMNHSRTLKNKINRLHERCLRLIYFDKKSSFEELLEYDRTMSIHHLNIQALAIQMYKISTDKCVPIVKDIFIHREQDRYNLRLKNKFVLPLVNPVTCGTESISFLGPKIWEMVPEYIKNKNTVKAFKTDIKKWKPENCPCRNCKTYVAGVGFL